jgi:hypothetical protein
LCPSKRLVVRFWDAATLTAFLFIVTVFLGYPHFATAKRPASFPIVAYPAG